MPIFHLGNTVQITVPFPLVCFDVAERRRLAALPSYGIFARSVLVVGVGNHGSEGKRMYEDMTLTCKECGNEFVFTSGEQEFYAEKGFSNLPQRCKSCRDARKRTVRGEREMFTTVCANCGKEAKVPFVPREDRPVYCSECFAQMREAN